MSDNENYNYAVLSYGQIEDKLMLAREHIDTALQQELTTEQRRKLTNMSNKVRAMMGKYRGV